jgi:predicted RNase H-like HicB family nuclease
MKSAPPNPWTRAYPKGCRFDTTRRDDPVATRGMDGAAGQGLAPGVHQGEPDGCRIEPQGRHQTWDTPFDLPRSRLGLPAETVRNMDVRNYIAIAEPSDDGTTWWISFPGLPGITSAADRPQDIARQAQDALASAVEARAKLPRAIEDGEIPAYDLGEYSNPLVLLVPYAAPAPATAG